MRKLASIVLAMMILVEVSPAGARPRPPVRRNRPPLRMTATAYCRHGRTRSGMKAQRGVAAADLRRFPLGTRLRVAAPGKTGNGTYTVLDSGSAIRGRHLDIFMPSCGRARKFGKRPVKVRVLR